MRATVLVRAGWWLAVTLVLGTFAASLPTAWSLLHRPCASAGCEPRLSAAALRALGTWAPGVDVYASVLLTLYVGFAGLCLAVAWLLVRRARNVTGALAALTLLTFGASFPFTVNELIRVHPAWRWPGGLVEMLSQVSFVAFAYWFPHGRPRPRWTLLPVVTWAVVMAPTELYPGSALSLERLPESVNAALVLGCLAPVPVVQVLRYRRESDAVARQQTKWVVWGLVVGVGGLVALSALWTSASAVSAQQRLPWLALGAQVSTYGVVAAVPVSVGLAVLRHRLWDADVVIRRTVLYALLAAALTAAYVLVVAGLGVLVPDGDRLASATAAVVLALAFAPLRDRLRALLDRLFYGSREDPYRAMSRLARRVAETRSAEEVLGALAVEVRAALRVPRVEVWLCAPDGLVLTAADGDGPGGEADDAGVPVRYDGEDVARLRVSRRAPGEPLTPADLRLLCDLAAQAGPVARAALLARALERSLHDLRDSRARLMRAQEEERARIQRDLHDELGPTLAALRLRLEACLEQLPAGPVAEEILALHDVVGRCSQDVRAIVRDLRPAALGEAGLETTLRRHCERVARESGVAVTFAMETDAPVPSDAEVAAYRVVREALHNTVRHADARSAHVRVSAGSDDLVVTVSDDGRGIPADATGDGIGLSGMRQRVELLGGRMLLRAVPGAGTELSVRLPMATVRA